MENITPKKCLKPAIFVDKSHLTPEGFICPIKVDEVKETENEITISSATTSHDTLNEMENAIVTKVSNVPWMPPAEVENNIKKSKISSYDCALKFIKNATLRRIDEQIYHYCEGIYKPISDADLKTLIVRYCRDEVEKKGTPRYVKEVCEFLHILPEIEISEPPKTSLVAFRNAILDTATWQIFPHTPQIFLTSRIEAELTCTTQSGTPYFDQFLQHTFSGDRALISRVWEMIGYILTEDNNGKCFFVLQGVGDSGKSLLGRFITSFFDKDAVSNLELSRLSDKFSLSALVGKRINANLDLANGKISRQAISVIKQLTGGDALTGERKFENSFSFTNSCKLLFATNHPLKLTERDDAFKRRVIVIPFEKSVPKEHQDKTLFEKFVREKNEIAIKALMSYRRLVENSYIFSGEEYINEYADCVRSDFTAIKKFVQEKCIFCSFEDGTFTCILYDSFVNFCFENNFTMMENIEDFSRKFRIICGERVKPSKWRDSKMSTNSLRGYKGIKLI